MDLLRSYICIKGKRVFILQCSHSSLQSNDQSVLIQDPFSTLNTRGSSLSSLRKYAYSNIMKILLSKKGKFSDKNFDIFSYFAKKHRLWVLVRTASARRFLRVPTIYVFSKIRNRLWVLVRTASARRF